MAVGHQGLDKSEAEVLDSLLARISTYTPPPGTDIDAVHAAWPTQAGRDYINAIYRPKPIGSLLSDELIVHRQWFLMNLSHVVTVDDAVAIIRSARSAGALSAYDIHDDGDFFGMSRRQPTRLARYVGEYLAPQLDEAALACTAELLVARAAVQQAGCNFGIWPTALTRPDQRHSIEVELVLLADSAKTFTWHRDEGGRFVFRSAELTRSLQSTLSEARKATSKLAAAEKKIRQLTDEIRRLQAGATGASDGELVGRFRQVYRKHVQTYHPDKLTGRSEADRKVGEEVTRVLNAIYQDIKI